MKRRYKQIKTCVYVCDVNNLVYFLIFHLRIVKFIVRYACGFLFLYRRCIYSELMKDNEKPKRKKNMKSTKLDEKKRTE